MAGSEVFDDVAFYYVATALVGTVMIFSTIWVFFSNLLVVIFGDSDRLPVKSEDQKFINGRHGFLLKQPAAEDEKFKEDEAKRKEKYQQSGIFTKTNLFLLIGWILFFYLLSLRSTMNSANFVTFEPYEILDIKYGATEQEIKKAYRKLSLKWHPDVHGDDTRAEAEKHFMLLTKAYYALTDPTTRDNYERYGNPDGANSGPASMTYGLPAFLSDKRYEIYILIGYLILFITVPVFFGYRFFASVGKASTNDTGVATETIQWFLGELQPNMDCKQLVEITSLAMEFRSGFNSAQPTPERLEGLKALIPKLQGLPQHKHAKVFYIMYGNALFHAYTQRVDIPIENQDDLKLYLKTAPKLHHMIAEIARSNRGMIPFLGAIDLIQSTIQRAPLDFAHPFWQFMGPDFNQIHIKQLFEAGINSMGALQSAPREEIIKAMGCSEAAYDRIITQLYLLPRLKMDLKAEVSGSEGAAPKDILQIDYSFERMYNDKDHENPSGPVLFPIPNKAKAEAAARLKAGLNEKGEPMTKEEINEAKRKKMLEKIDRWDVYIGSDKKSQQLQSKAHTPENVPDVVSHSYPFQKKEVWYIALLWIVNGREMLIDSRVINNFGDNAVPLTGKLMVQLPEKAGVCTYRFVIRCDSYLGVDMARLIHVNVLDPDQDKKDKKAAKKAEKAKLLAEKKAKFDKATVELIEEEDIDTGEVKLVEDKDAEKKKKNKEDKEDKEKGGDASDGDSEGEKKDEKKDEEAGAEKKKFLSPGDLEDDDSDSDDEKEGEEEEDIFQDELEQDDPEDLPTYWYYLGGSSFMEGLVNLLVFTVLGFLLYHYCHDKAWWKRWIQPNINKAGVLIKPYWEQVEVKIMPVIEPLYYKLDSTLRYFLGDGDDGIPMNIKLERAYNARGRRF